jgi:RNA polymerase sigma factor (sigma-70 family)
VLIGKVAVSTDAANGIGASAARDPYRRGAKLVLDGGVVRHRREVRHTRAPRMVNLAADRPLIGDALAQLSAEHRDVIRRSYYEARTTAQIADDLQIAETTVQSRLHYAMRALRRAVQEMGVTDNL